jgi:hypothetical protein
MRRAAILLALAVVASGCMTTRAQTPVERPALDVPPAPPRIIEPAPPPLTEIAEVPELPPEEPVTAPPIKPRPAPPAVARDTQKPDVKPDTPPADTVVAQAPAVPLLRTPATADTVAAQRQINETLIRAQKALYSVDFDRLTPARQKWYNEAKDFITEAETHLKASNLEAAKELAEKAEKYATLLLQGR